jgi:ubiquinone/menaquinone biosynthesis C-methylase UbiE
MLHDFVLVRNNLVEYTFIEKFMQLRRTLTELFGFIIIPILIMQKFESIRQNYDRLSLWYDMLEGWGERSISMRALQLLDLRPGEQLLEIGCGTGANLVRLGQQVPGNLKLGLDLSFGMCQVAQRKLSHYSCEHIYPLEGNAIKLPFSTRRFSATLCCFSLEIIPANHLPIALEEIRRVLNPGGRLCVAAMAEEEQDGLMMRMYRWSMRQFPQVVDCRPIRLATILNEAGFELLQNQLLSLWGLPVRLILVNKNL